jgi:hypothetical protein
VGEREERREKRIDRGEREWAAAAAWLKSQSARAVQRVGLGHGPLCGPVV